MRAAKQRLVAAIFGVVFLCGAGCGDSSGDPTAVTGTIRGTVTDVDTGAPLSGATVQFGTTAGVTGGDGTYQIDGVPQGGLTLTVDRPGYWRYNGWVVFVASTGGLVRDVAMTSRVEGTSGLDPASDER